MLNHAYLDRITSFVVLIMDNKTSDSIFCHCVKSYTYSHGAKQLKIAQTKTNGINITQKFEYINQ